MEPLLAGCFQLNVALGDLVHNTKTVRTALSQFAQAGCRLVVLPEMWSCGFAYPQLEAMAARTPDILAELQEWSRRYGMVLVGSLPERDGGKVYNSSYVTDLSGRVVGKYRKAHLFSPEGEHQHFGQGETPLICTTEIGKLGILICYDLRFPELSRKLALEGADVLCVSSLWPKARIEHWSLLLRSRALENQLFVVGCNGSGSKQDLIYGGRSAIVTPTGCVLAEAKDGETTIMTALDFEAMRLFRRQIPCFSDRNPKVYQ